jgi:hypothetical protein
VTGTRSTGSPAAAAGLAFASSDEDYRRELSEFVAVPSVSRDADQQTMLAAATWLAGQLGFAAGRVVPTRGQATDGDRPGATCAAAAVISKIRTPRSRQISLAPTYDCGRG